MNYSLQERIQHHKGLLESDDVHLFCNGGCHVFALALHERFNYPIHLIPGHSNNRVAHIYCKFAGSPAYAVDVLGFTPEDDRVWRDFSGLSVSYIDRTNLLQFYQPLSNEGMCGEDWFVRPARQRADCRIEKYIDVFSGQLKARIADIRAHA